jgi:hypothetical protein
MLLLTGVYLLKNPPHLVNYFLEAKVVVGVVVVVVVHITINAVLLWLSEMHILKQAKLYVPIFHLIIL